MSLIKLITLHPNVCEFASLSLNQKRRWTESNVTSVTLWPLVTRFPLLGLSPKNMSFLPLPPPPLPYIPITSSLTPYLLFISYLLSVFGSCISLNIMKYRTARNGQINILLLLLTTLILSSITIWSMHFIIIISINLNIDINIIIDYNNNLELNIQQLKQINSTSIYYNITQDILPLYLSSILPIPPTSSSSSSSSGLSQLSIYYDPLYTFLSFLLSLNICFYALYFGSNRDSHSSLLRLLIASIPTGFSIYIIHYISLLSILYNYIIINYNINYIIGSIVLNTFGMIISLWLFFYVWKSHIVLYIWTNHLLVIICCSTIMGLLIWSGNYLAILGISFTYCPFDCSRLSSTTQQPASIYIYVIIILLFISLLSIIILIRYIKFKTEEEKNALSCLTITLLCIDPALRILISNKTKGLPSVVIEQFYVGIGFLTETNPDFLLMFSASFNWYRMNQQLISLQKRVDLGQAPQSNVDFLSRFINSVTLLASNLNLNIEELGRLYYLPTTPTTVTIVCRMHKQEKIHRIAESGHYRFVPREIVIEFITKYYINETKNQIVKLNKEFEKQQRRQSGLSLTGVESPDTIERRSLKVEKINLLNDNSDITQSIAISTKETQPISSSISSTSFNTSSSKAFKNQSTTNVNVSTLTPQEEAEEWIDKLLLYHDSCRARDTDDAAASPMPASPISASPSALAPEVKLHVSLMYTQVRSVGVQVLLPRYGALHQLPSTQLNMPAVTMLPNIGNLNISSISPASPKSAPRAPLLSPRRLPSLQLPPVTDAFSSSSFSSSSLPSTIDVNVASSSLQPLGSVAASSAFASPAPVSLTSAASPDAPPTDESASSSPAPFFSIPIEMFNRSDSVWLSALMTNPSLSRLDMVKYKQQLLDYSPGDGGISGANGAGTGSGGSGGGGGGAGGDELTLPGALNDSDGLQPKTPLSRKNSHNPRSGGPSRNVSFKFPSSLSITSSPPILPSSSISSPFRLAFLDAISSLARFLGSSNDFQGRYLHSVEPIETDPFSFTFLFITSTMKPTFPSHYDSERWFMLPLPQFEVIHRAVHHGRGAVQKKSITQNGTNSVTPKGVSLGINNTIGVNKNDAGGRNSDWIRQVLREMIDRNQGPKSKRSGFSDRERDKDRVNNSIMSGKGRVVRDELSTRETELVQLSPKHDMLFTPQTMNEAGGGNFILPSTTATAPSVALPLTFAMTRNASASALPSTSGSSREFITPFASAFPSAAPTARSGFDAEGERRINSGGEEKEEESKVEADFTADIDMKMPFSSEQNNSSNLESIPLAPVVARSETEVDSLNAAP